MADKKEKSIDAYMESMKAYQKTYDFLLYIYPILSGFPKFEKFALQTQIKAAIFEMLKDYYQIQKDRDQKPYIQRRCGTAVYKNAYTAFL